MTIDSVSNNSSSTQSTETQPKGVKALGVDDFMKLLVTQLTMQDPMKPMEDTAFIAQMASFTSLEQMRGLSTEFASFSKSQRMGAAQSYLGKQVTLIDGDGKDVTGRVTSVNMNDGKPEIMVNGVNYDPVSVTQITQ